MEAVAKMPVTLDDRFEFDEKLSIAATFVEFLDLLEICEYRIEYDEGKIFSFLGFGTESHELLIPNIIGRLFEVLGEDDYTLFGSNLVLHIPGVDPAILIADCPVVKGKIQRVTLRGDMTAVANPILLVEVLSASTKDHDLGRKFRNYRKIPTLQQILFIESTEKLIVSHTRQSDGKKWLLSEYTADDELIPVLGEGAFRLGDLYKKIEFEEA